MRSMRSSGVRRMSQKENMPALLTSTSTSMPSARVRSKSSCDASRRARSMASVRTSTRGWSARISAAARSSRSGASPAMRTLYPSPASRAA